MRKWKRVVAVWVMAKRTYLDTCVLIAAFKGDSPSSMRAMEILDDPDRSLLISDAVRLEALPKARYHHNDKEVEFYEAVFEQAEKLSWDYGVLGKAFELATNYGIAAMDAIHVAHAVAAGADEFVSNEKATKPMFRVREITTRSLRPE